MYACMYVCMHVCMSVYICIYVYMYVCMYVCRPDRTILSERETADLDKVGASYYHCCCNYVLKVFLSSLSDPFRSGQVRSGQDNSSKQQQ